MKHSKRRHAQRFRKNTLALAIAACGSTAQAATIEVDSLAGTIDGGDGVTTLREAITQANTDEASDTIVFASELSGTINIGAGNELPIVGHELEIDGDGRITLDAQGGAWGVRGGEDAPTIPSDTFYGSNTNLTLRGLTITGATNMAVEVYNDGNGGLQVLNCVITGNGGALRSRGFSHETVIRDSSIVDNTGAFGPSPIYHDSNQTRFLMENSVVSGNSGGSTAVFVGFPYDSTEESDVFVHDSTIIDNDMGGIEIYGASFAEVENSVVSGNTSTEEGTAGGMTLNYSQATVVDSTLANNSASEIGGAIHAESSTLEVVRSNITGNTADRFGGGISFQEGDESTVRRDFMLHLDSSVVADNTAGHGGGGVYIDDKTVSTSPADADISMTGSQITGNSVTDEGTGGGLSIRINGDDFAAASLDISGSEISDNTAAESGGGLYGSWGYVETGIVNSVISDNMANDGRGGGIYLRADHADTVVRRTVVSGNTASLDGGGVYLYSSNTGEPSYLSIDQSSLIGNTAYAGGGASAVDYNGEDSPILFVSNSTISGNTATGGFGGGLKAFTYYGRAGVEAVNSTISGNRAEDGGSAIAALGNNPDPGDYYGRAYIDLHGVTVTDNVTVGSNSNAHERAQILAGVASWYDITINHSVAYSDSSDPDVGISNSRNTEGDWVSAEYSLIGSIDADGGGTEETSPLAVSDPLLGPLADNGGFTQTHLPQPGSPLINGGATSVPGELDDQDQRGVTRFDEGSPMGGNVDVGAVEIYNTSGGDTEQNRPPTFSGNLAAGLGGAVGDNVSINIFDYVSDPDGDTIDPENLWFFDSLPSGLDYNDNTGEISGTLDAAGRSVVTVSASDELALGYAQVTVTVVSEAPSSSSPSSDDDDDDFLGSLAPAWLLALAGLIGLRRGQRRRTTR